MFVLINEDSEFLKRSVKIISQTFREDNKRLIEICTFKWQKSEFIDQCVKYM